MSGRLTFWILFAVTLGVYGVMVLWSLPTISAAAGGLAPFDMRPGGYGFADAQAFLAALTPEGSAFYRNFQHWLDAAYMALLAATLFFAIAGLAPTRLGGWRWVLAALAIPGSMFDYLENAAVARMLAAGAERLTPELVETATRWTVLKSWFTTLAMAILLVLLAGWALRKVRRGRGVAAS